jgi:hypothetical protein
MAEFVKMYLDDISHNIGIVAADQYTSASLRANDSARLSQILENLKMSPPEPDAVLFVDNDGYATYSSAPNHITNITVKSWYNEMASSNGT